MSIYYQFIFCFQIGVGDKRIGFGLYQTRTRGNRGVLDVCLCFGLRWCR